MNPLDKLAEYFGEFPGIEQQAKLEHLQSEISLLTLYQSHLAKYGKQNAAAYFATSTTP
jgi:hypothetical protein